MKRPSLNTALHVRLASLWFALFAQWLTVLPVILPEQIAAIVGPDSVKKKGMTGSIAEARRTVRLAFPGLLPVRRQRGRPQGQHRPGAEHSRRHAARRVAHDSYGFSYGRDGNLFDADGHVIGSVALLPYRETERSTEETAGWAALPGGFLLWNV